MEALVYLSGLTIRRVQFWQGAAERHPEQREEFQLVAREIESIARAIARERDATDNGDTVCRHHGRPLRHGPGAGLYYSSCEQCTPEG